MINCGNFNYDESAPLNALVRINAGSNGINSLGSSGLTVPSAGELSGISLLVPGTIYSAAGTPLPAASAALKGARAVVSDATTPTFLGAYTSGGAVVAPVLCTGTGWVTA